MKLGKPKMVALVVAVSLFMQNLDTTAVNTALPEMARSFDTNVSHLSIAVTSYLVALAIFIPISGWIANRFGSRVIFCSAVFLFSLTSILCGRSETLTHFIMFRFFQGMAGALMTPVGRLAVLKATPKDQLIITMAYITWPALVAPVCGPLIGGYLTTYFSWHYIFYLNAPIGLLCIPLAWYFIPKDKDEDKNEEKFDSIGFTLTGISLACLMIGVEIIGRAGIPFYLPIIFILVSLALIYFNVKYSKRIANPIINYSILKISTYRTMIFTGSLSLIVICSVPYLVPLMFQEGFGLTSFHAGLLFLASSVGSLVMKPVTVWVMERFNFRSSFLVNGILVVLFTFLTSILFPTTPKIFIILVMFMSGVVRSFQYSAVSTLAFADVPKESMASANTLFTTAKQIAVAGGVALGSIFLRLSQKIHGDIGHSYTVSDFHLSFIFVAVFAFISLYGYMGLKSDAGDAVRTKKN